MNDRGVVYLKKRQFQRVLDDFDRALLMNPAHVEASKNRELATAGLAKAKDGRGAGGDAGGKAN